MRTNALKSQALILSLSKDEGTTSGALALFHQIG
jgi:hypothetical protein